LSNLYYNGGTSQMVHLTTGAGCYVQLYGGDINFYTAPSGTVGNAATPTRRMALFENGHLQLGTYAAAADNGITLTASGECYFDNFYASGTIPTLVGALAGDSWVDTGFRFYAYGGKWAICVYLKQAGHSAGSYSAWNAASQAGQFLVVRIA
jgi:hypothetical protein